MKKQLQTCECCGAKVVEYKHGLSKGLVIGLIKIGERTDMSKTGSISVNLNDLNLPLAQRTNFQKLKYWGLVDKADRQSLKGGKWDLTQKGLAFLFGTAKVPRYVWTYRGKVASFEDEEIGINDIFEGYKYRPEWAKEAQPRSNSLGLFPNVL